MDIHELIGKLPRPKHGFVLPSHKYTGPYNPLHDQLDAQDNPVPGQEPFNAVDEISMRHDICYRDNTSKQDCDEKMLNELEQLDPKDLRERFDKSLVKGIIGMKRKLGWGIDPPKTITWTSALADELHKPIRRNFPRRKVFGKGPGIWAADLVEMIPYARQNKGFKYILTIIDIFTKYAWAVPLKTKTGVEVADAFKKIFKENMPEKIWVDNGKEFFNSSVKKLLDKHKIILYTTHNELKSCVVERFNRTIKTKMWKYFTANYTHKYIDILPALIEKYNNTRHSSIKTTPNLAKKKENHVAVFQALNNNKLRGVHRDIPKFSVGDRVRITKKKGIFDKGFTPNWRDEIFIISKRKTTSPPTYIIRDERGEELGGTFYEPELQKSKTEEYRIQKILKRRTRNGQKQEYVKWYGYDNSHNQWINV